MRATLAIFLLLFAISGSAIAQPIDCDSPHRNKTFTSTTIIPILEAHTRWLASDQRDNKGRAILCSTNLTGVKLTEKDLSKIDLRGADLSNTDFSGSTFTEAQLHKAFFRGANLLGTQFYEADLREASFQEAKLLDANLNQANLSNANFIDANLNRASLRGATLTNSNLSHAKLRYANLSWADLSGADLSDADLTGADLSHAKLIGAKLDQTILIDTNFLDADLSQAIITPIDITKANMTNANLHSAIFQPTFGTAPDLISLAHSQHIDTIRLADFKTGVANLNQIRKSYKDLGIRHMERKITALIKKEEMLAAWHSGGWGRLESMFSYVLFYLTCDFGAAPGRPLFILLLLVLVFTLPYRYALTNPDRKSGILVIWKPKRFVDWSRTRAISTIDKDYCCIIRHRRVTGWYATLKQQLHFISVALFFSLNSAFTIGWRELNVSNWIMRMQTRDFYLRGKGWVQALAGFQSIISAYLVVMWILTYFGRPFEW